MKKIGQEPRLAPGPGLFGSLVSWAREVALAINTNVDALLGFTVGRTGTSGTVATVAPVNGGNGDARLVLDKFGPTQNAVITASKSGLKRWEWVLGNAVAESGANAGSDCGLDRCNDAGTVLGTAISFRRSDGLVTVPGAISAGSTVTAAGNVSAPTFLGSGGQCIGWSSMVTGSGETYEMLAYSPTGSGGGATNYVRSYHLHGVWAGWQFICLGTGIFEMRNNGTGYSVGGWVATSDERVKFNLRAIDDVLSWLDEIRVVEFDRLDAKEIDGTPVHQLGFIAQDFEPHAPAVVLQDPPTEDRPEPIRSLNYDSTTALLWRAVQQLKAELAEVRAEIQSMKGS